LMNVFEPLGVSVRFADTCDLAGLRAVVAEAQPGCIVMESISNPLLRVGEIDQVAAIAREVGAALVVDNTFATPLLARPLELGADYSVHSVTKYLAGHGDVLGGVVVTLKPHADSLRALGRTIGGVLGPFECYLTMRGIKTFPLRMERQCANARWVAMRLPYGFYIACLAAIVDAIAVVHKVSVWATHHTTRFPDGVDLVPASNAASNQFDPGQWERMARDTALSLEHWTIALALVSIVVVAGLTVKRRYFSRPAPATYSAVESVGAPSATMPDIGNTP